MTEIQPDSGIPGNAGAPEIPEGRLLAPGAVAKLFGVDPRTVTRWVDKGLLKPILTPGGHRRYRYLDVMALRDRLAVDAGPPISAAPGAGMPQGLAGNLQAAAQFAGRPLVADHLQPGAIQSGAGFPTQNL